MTKTLVCRDCRQEKPVSEFYRYRDGKYRCSCKPCCWEYEASKRAAARARKIIQSDISALINSWQRAPQ